jgi:hypothetical protein
MYPASTSAFACHFERQSHVQPNCIFIGRNERIAHQLLHVILNVNPMYERQLIAGVCCFCSSNRGLLLVSGNLVKLLILHTVFTSKITMVASYAHLHGHWI